MGDPSRIFVLEECLENALGYEPPAHDKPFNVYQICRKWNNIVDVPTKWRKAFEGAMGLRSESVVEAAATQDQDS